MPTSSDSTVRFWLLGLLWLAGIAIRLTTLGTILSFHHRPHPADTILTASS
jgi:hypothetical protein